jgi:hypothetical protein
MARVKVDTKLQTAEPVMQDLPAAKFYFFTQQEEDCWNVIGPGAVQLMSFLNSIAGIEDGQEDDPSNS